MDVNPELTEEQRDILFQVWSECDEDDKSSEYMFNLMVDMADVTYDDAVNFVTNTTLEQQSEWYNKKTNKDE